ncbi:MAG: SHOCT domain-containing protein [Thermodesulfobacteriota bacterium]
MKRYLALSLPVAAGLLVSCAGDGYMGAQGRRGWGSMMHYGFGYGGMFMWIIFLIVVGFLIYFIVQAQKGKDQTLTHSESPLDILKRRYAKGEITKDEYDRMRKDME